MATVWQFVADMSGASPTVLLDLNSASTGLWVADGYNLSPATYDKGWVGNPMRHGQRPTRSSAQNFQLTLPLQVNATSNQNAANSIQTLGLLLRNDGFIKYQADGATNPVFFKTFADPDYGIEIAKTRVHKALLQLKIDCEPFAYSPRVEHPSSPFTVSNDPAAGANPMYFDMASVVGDVETPLLLVATSTGATNGLMSKWTHVSTRRRGTPSNYSNVIQAEAMTFAGGSGTAAAVDAAMSGGNKATITPGTATHILRCSDTFPANGLSTIEARGEYNVYGRFKKSAGADTWTVQLKYGTDATAPVANDIVTLPAGAAGPFNVLLGKIPVPAWSDPATLGASGIPLKVQVPFVGLYAGRSVGAGTLDIDFLYFMPADESMVITKWPATDVAYALDGTTAEGGSAYAITAALDEVVATATPPQIAAGGGFPELIPGGASAVNRIHFMRQVDPAGTVDGITNTTTIHAYYWPRNREPFRT